MRIGFTGTQLGMTDHQKHGLLEKLCELFDANCICELHHGDCIGADEQAHTVGALTGYTIVIHPPSNDSKRAFCFSHNMLLPKPYLERNHDIVDACSLLIAAPSSNDEELRSGTWATVRYARKTGKPVHILQRY